MDDPKSRTAQLTIADRRRLLAALRSTDESSHAVLRARGPAVEAPMSAAQRTLWFIDQLTSGTNAYNLVHYYKITGEVDVAALERAFRSVVQRQQALRTCLRQSDHGTIQIIVPDLPVALHVVDHPGTVEDCMERGRQELALEPIPLDRPPLWRIRLYRRGPGRYLLVFAIHHAVFDGASEGVFCAELAEFYRAETTGTDPVLPELTVQYTDYACWQRDRLDSGELAAHTEFWRGQLAGMQDLRLPVARPRSGDFTYRGNSVSVPLPEDLPGAVRELVRGLGVTPLVVYLTAFWLLLHQASGQEDITIGTSISGRGRPQLERLLGYFVHVMALRWTISDDISPREAMRRAGSTFRTAMAHSELPFEQVVGAVMPQRDLSRSPVFQVTFVTTPDLPAPRLAGTDVEQLFLNHGIARFDMSWVVVETSPPGVAVQFSTDTFDRPVIESMMRHYGRLVEWCINHMDEPVAKAPRMVDPTSG